MYVSNLDFVYKCFALPGVCFPDPRNSSSSARLSSDTKRQLDKYNVIANELKQSPILDHSTNAYGERSALQGHLKATCYQAIEERDRSLVGI
jgi:hypothetical protein